MHALVNLLDDRNVASAASPILRAILDAEVDAISEARERLCGSDDGASGDEAKDGGASMSARKKRVPSIIKLVCAGWCDCFCEEVRVRLPFGLNVYILRDFFPFDFII